MSLNMPFDKVVEKIIAETGLSKEEVHQRIDEKVKELGGLITLEGAAHIIARELEINLYDEQAVEQPKPTTIDELLSGMNNISIRVMIKNVYPVKKFTRKDGTPGAVQNIVLVDKTGKCRLVLWDEQIRAFKELDFTRGDVIEIKGAFVKESKFDELKELSLSSRSNIDEPKNINQEQFPNALLKPKQISELTPELTDVEVIGKIIAVGQINHFKRKDNSEGQVASLEIADESGKIRVTLWDQRAEEIHNYKVDDIIRIVGGYTRKGIKDTLEIHLGRNGYIRKEVDEELEIPEEIVDSQGTLLPKMKKSGDPVEIRFADLEESMNNISVIGRVSGISTIREFTRSDGTKGYVGSLMVKDHSGPGRITLWGNNTEYLKRVKIGDVIRLESAYVKLGLKGEPEVHAGNATVIEINPEYLVDAVPELDLKHVEINELEPKQRDVNVRAVVIRVQELRSFEKSDGSEGKVLNIEIGDSSGSARLVAWGKQAIELEDLEEGRKIDILHGYTKQGQQGIELHLGSLSTIRRLGEGEAPELTSVVSSPSPSRSSQEVKRVDMVDLVDGERSEIRGTILKVYESRLHYLSCPNCRKKVIEDEEGNWLCKEHGIVDEPGKTLYLPIALDDGTGCVRVTFFRDLAEELLDLPSDTIIDEIEQIGIQSVIIKLEQRIKGREIIVRGRAKQNDYDDGMDLVAYSFSEFDPKAEIDRIKGSLKV
ncbi:MAG: DUF2240 family protein [Candidatus Heimdallarchaeota archaeon]|nr:DUF2240 family protein [Candidatus Heimdallarchaeota archaeon]